MRIASCQTILEAVEVLRTHGCKPDSDGKYHLQADANAWARLEEFAEPDDLALVKSVVTVELIG